jgi:hypothetical protein
MGWLFILKVQLKSLQKVLNIINRYILNNNNSIHKGFFMNIFKFMVSVVFIVSPVYSLEHFSHLFNKKKPSRNETIQERTESICNGLIAQESLAFEAYEKCQKRLEPNQTTIDDKKAKRDACILQSIFYECALRRQIPVKIEEDSNN